MHTDELEDAFDKQAVGYDKQWERLEPIRNALYLLLDTVFAGLPADARILCVGVGTGAELAHFARRFPCWSFTAVDPSGPMLDICRRRADAEGLTSRCRFHQGYLDSVPHVEKHDAATCFLVSQFLLEERERSTFFQEIASRLKPDGILASSDLAAEVGSPDFEVLLAAWAKVMTGGDESTETLERMRKAYANDVAVLPPNRVASIIESGGFAPPVQLFQAGLIHAWYSKRASDPSA